MSAPSTSTEPSMNDNNIITDQNEPISIPTAPPLDADLYRPVGISSLVYSGQYEIAKRDQIRILVSSYRKSVRSSFYNSLKKQLSNNNSELINLGFNNSLIDLKAKNLADYEFGGRTQSLVLWRYFAMGLRAVILLIDATDKKALGYEKLDWFKGTYSSTPTKWYRPVKSALASQLEALGSGEIIDPEPLLIFTIKQNVENSLSNEEIMKAISGNEEKYVYVKRPIHIQSLDIKTNNGLIQGMDWLSKQLCVDTPNKDTNDTTQIEGQISNRQADDKQQIQNSDKVKDLPSVDKLKTKSTTNFLTSLIKFLF